MSSGQWDLQALEAIEREASGIFDALDVPERLRSPAKHQNHHPHQHPYGSGGRSKMLPCRPICRVGKSVGGGAEEHPASKDESAEFELQDHIKHCSCSCNHMGYGNFMDYQQTTTCFGGLPDVTEHTNSKGIKRLCKFNKQHLPPLIETLASNESLVTTQTTAYTSLTASPATIGTPADHLDIFDTKSRCASASGTVHPNPPPPTLYGPTKSGPGLPEAAELLTSRKVFSPTASLKYGPVRTTTTRSYSPVADYVGICGLTSLKLNNKREHAADAVFGETDLGDEISHQQRERRADQKKAQPERKWCLFIVTLLIGLSLSIVTVSFLLELLLGGDSSTADRHSQDYRLSTIRQILKETPLIDGHNHLAWNIKRFSDNRFELLHLAKGLDDTAPYSSSPYSQTDIPKLKRGMVGAQFWSAYVPCEAQGLDAVQLALEQIDVIQRFTLLYGEHTSLATSSKEIMQTHDKGLLASMIGVEGGHALGSSLGVLRTIYTLGARYLTLTHKCDIPWAGSSATHTDRGLSNFGRSVIKEMNRLGMIIDLSHSSDQTAREVLKETRAPVIYSHSAARALCNLTRNIDDELLRMVAENGGIVMVSFYSVHISCRHISTITDVIAHINYIRAVAGIQHIGIGAGYDGIDRPPIGLEDVSKYPNLFVKLLEDPNWSQHDISLLAGKNFLRVFESVENVRDYWRSAQVAPIEKMETKAKSPCAYMPS